MNRFNKLKKYILQPFKNIKTTLSSEVRQNTGCGPDVASGHRLPTPRPYLTVIILFFFNLLQNIKDERIFLMPNTTFSKRTINFIKSEGILIVNIKD